VNLLSIKIGDSFVKNRIFSRFLTFKINAENPKNLTLDNIHKIEKIL